MNVRVDWDHDVLTTSRTIEKVTAHGQELPFRITFDGPEEDGSWGVEVALLDGQRLLTGGASIEDALRNAVESWPDELAILSSQPTPTEGGPQ